MTVEKPKPKQLLRPITTGASSAMNQSQFLAITCNSLKVREKSRVRGAIGFDSHWLKNWRESLKPITKFPVFWLSFVSGIEKVIYFAWDLGSRSYITLHVCKNCREISKHSSFSPLKCSLFALNFVHIIVRSRHHVICLKRDHLKLARVF